MYGFLYRVVRLNYKSNLASMTSDVTTCHHQTVCCSRFDDSSRRTVCTSPISTAAVILYFLLLFANLFLKKRQKKHVIFKAIFVPFYIKIICLVNTTLHIVSMSVNILKDTLSHLQLILRY